MTKRQGIDREYLSMKLKEDGLQTTNINGWFIGNDYVKVSISMFEMELDTCIVVYKMHSLPYGLGDYITLKRCYLLDETLI